MSKFGMLVGAGVGYVLGARDGRERYEQIREQAQRVWKDPRVQQKKDQAAQTAKQKGGELQDKAGQKASEHSSSDSSVSSSAGTSGSKPSPVTPTSTTGSQGGTAGTTTTGTTTTGTSTTGTTTTGTSTSGTGSNGAAGSTPGKTNG